MAITFKCPKCGKAFKVKDELAGKVAGCPCGAKFKIPVPQTPPPPPAPKPKAEPAAQPEPARPPVKEPVPAAAAASSPAFDFRDEAEEPAPVRRAMEDDDTMDPDSNLLGSEPQDDEVPSEAEEQERIVGRPAADADEEEASEDEAGGKPSAEDGEEGDHEEDLVKPKSVLGRLMVLVGVGALAAALALPWGSTEPVQKGYEMVLEQGGFNPLVYGLFASAGVGLFLFLLAVIGKGGFLLGLIFGLLTLAGAGVGIFGVVNGAADVVAKLMEMIQTLPAMMAETGGAALCFLGGLICGAGCMGSPRPAKKGKAPKAKKPVAEKKGRDKDARAAKADVAEKAPKAAKPAPKAKPAAGKPAAKPLPKMTPRKPLGKKK